MTTVKIQAMQYIVYLPKMSATLRLLYLNAKFLLYAERDMAQVSNVLSTFIGTYAACCLKMPQKQIEALLPNGQDLQICSQEIYP